MPEQAILQFDAFRGRFGITGPQSEPVPPALTRAVMDLRREPSVLRVTGTGSHGYPSWEVRLKEGVSRSMLERLLDDLQDRLRGYRFVYYAGSPVTPRGMFVNAILGQ